MYATKFGDYENPSWAQIQMMMLKSKENSTAQAKKSIEVLSLAQGNRPLDRYLLECEENFMEQDVNEPLRKTIFLAGLGDKYKEHVLLQSPATWEEARRCALNYDAVMQLTGKETGNANRNERNNTRTQDRVKQWKKYDSEHPPKRNKESKGRSRSQGGNKRRDSSRGRSDSKQTRDKSSDRKPGKGKCPIPGHLAKDCRNPQHGDKANTKGGNNNIKTDSDTCRKCGKKGHWAKECPKADPSRQLIIQHALAEGTNEKPVMKFKLTNNHTLTALIDSGASGFVQQSNIEAP